MSTTKRYWQDLGELSEAPQVPTNEFNTPLPFAEALGDKGLTGSTTGRRDFLKFLGFSLSAATLAACETPVVKSIPYVTKPEDITPGVANWYASTFYDGEDFASVLVKTREGRPIHIKGNPRFGINRNPNTKKGSINSRINSSVITLYDSLRQKGPVSAIGDGSWTASSWASADKAIMEGLTKISASGKRIVLLTNTVISPSAKQAIATFQNKIGGTSLAGDDGMSVQVGSKVDHIQYDTISYGGITNANLKSFGKRVFPSYDLSKADVLVSVGADFLSGWGNPTENVWQYAVRRRPEDATAEKPMSRHWQFEARMSLSGANADMRCMVKPSEIPSVVMGLHDAIAKKLGGATVGATSVASADGHIAECAAELLAAKGKSVVICGHNDEGTQVIVNSINAMLGNYGSTIDLTNHTFFKQGDDAAVQQLVKDMNAGNVGAILIAGVNPIYSLPNSAEFASGLKKVGLSVSFSSHADETASLCSVICPDSHWLESWNDFMPKPGHYALAQPAITPLFDTRQWPESLLTWSGASGNYHDHIKGVWQAAMTSRTDMPVDFTTAWNTSIHNGVYEAYTNAAEPLAFAGNLTEAASTAKESVKGAGEWEVQLYTKESIGSGLHANNPWLQEVPDPLTKVTWDNYVCMAPADLLRLTKKTEIKELRIGEQDDAHIVKVTIGNTVLELPAVPLPGQTPMTVSIALGYGRGANGENVGRAACLHNDDGNVMPIGKNAYPLTSVSNGAMKYVALNASVDVTGEMYQMGLTQTQLTGMDRESIIKETTFAEWSKHEPRETYNEKEMLAVHEDVNHDDHIDARDKVPATDVNLWKDHPVAEVGHHWGMAIDLNSCTGCGACITACNSENNVSVVGKDEVRRSRDMHWMRLDRYYSSDTTWEEGREKGEGKIGLYRKMEEPSASPKVFFMPVMCQHCNHAPCETVCPVAATTHSNEGLNMMTYNRCIGTRYCANNCPYKVRRFNWFNYVTEKFGEVNPAWDALGRMVLNPDVTVRSRGVIEKCSLCVQQIQGGKLAAKKAGTPVKDGAIETACSAGCPTNAITFGDLNDKNSKVLAIAESERAYHMLEEIGVKPNISYMVKVRNIEEEVAHVHETEAAHN
ncbi:MAG: TAT-variant-translocated molybdopterin oxidoreductase [Flavobacteriales bacterium]|nr:TAT-variant-translocated molybdopterin oxidoreductase [Flavobacteriales bacterium]MBL0045841.1 TAT-variant-translocated molybdopterin oxidoreductase [Flavobacteriales bacterium]